MLASVTRFLLFAGLVASVGGAVCAWLLRRAAGPGAADVARQELNRVRVFWLTGVAMVAAVSLVRGWMQVEGFRDPGDPFWSIARRVLAGTSWGRGGVLQLVGVFLSLVGARATARDAWRPGLPVLCGAVCLIAAPAWQGHAASADRLPLVVLLADILHTAAYAAWIGTLASLWFVLRMGRVARASGALHPLMAPLIARFSPLALACGATLAVTGASAALLHLTEVGDLWTSTWGRWLLAKLVAVAGVASAGAYNWRVVTPMLPTPAGATLLQAGLRRELLFATATLIVTAALTGTAPPGSE